ncbi:hypothetical protein Tco_1437632 [Tanacetum coccineum]
MFDIALRIVNDHKELASDGEVLRIMATKPDAFVENSSNILWKTINWVFAFVLSRRTLPKWIREELELLESMEDIRSSYEDLIKQDVNGNNVLHLVAKSAKRKRLQDVSGVAFQMHRDLLWGDKEVLEDLLSKCGDGGACKVVGWLLDDMVVRSWRRVVISTKKEAPVNFLTNPSDGRSTLRLALTFSFLDGLKGNMRAKEREDTSEKLLFTRLGNDRKDERNDGNDRRRDDIQTQGRGRGRFAVTGLSNVAEVGFTVWLKHKKINVSNSRVSKLLIVPTDVLRQHEIVTTDVVNVHKYYIDLLEFRSSTGSIGKHWREFVNEAALVKSVKVVAECLAVRLIFVIILTLSATAHGKIPEVESNKPNTAKFLHLKGREDNARG